MSELETALATDDLNAVATKLGGVQKNLGVLRDLPEFSSNQKRLEAFRDKLEEKARAKLNNALQERNAEASRECVAIYTLMGRSDAVHEAYASARKIALTKLWTKVMTSGGGDRGPEERIPQLYVELMSAVTEEFGWAKQVFEKPGEMVTALLSEFLRSSRSLFSETFFEVRLD